MLAEDTIRNPDILKSVQRYQIAIDKAKVILDLAISPITLLMPSNLPLNTESTAGYKNSLKKASANMKLEVNKSAHSELKSVGVRYMNGGPSKINGPTSHPSNTINKEELTSNH